MRAEAGVGELEEILQVSSNPPSEPELEIFQVSSNILAGGDPPCPSQLNRSSEGMLEDDSAK